MNEQLMRIFVELFGACTRASIITMGMQSRNMSDLVKHKSMTYNEEDFLKVIQDEGIGYNEILGRLYHN